MADFVEVFDYKPIAPEGMLPRHKAERHAIEQFGWTILEETKEVVPVSDLDEYGRYYSQTCNSAVNLWIKEADEASAWPGAQIVGRTSPSKTRCEALLARGAEIREKHPNKEDLTRAFVTLQNAITAF